MVAVSGSGWRLAPCLVALIEETDERFPNREHSSDGSIGDFEHSTRTSDHNPDSGWVCAVDIDENLTPTLGSLRFLWDLIVDRRDHRVKYLIYEGQIIKSYVDSAGHGPWVPYPYTGPNAHEHHLHVSVWNTPAARDDIGPWWTEPARPVVEEDDDMFSYEYDPAGAAVNTLVLVAGGKQVSITKHDVLLRRRQSDSHLGAVDKDEVDRFVKAYGPVIT